MTKVTRTLFTLLLISVAAHSNADFVVEQKGSHVGFASVKNDLIAENHFFTGISGGVDDGGNAMIAIILSTVETLIPIRNERMRTLLFDVDRHPLATVRSKVDINSVTALEVGESLEQNIDLTIDLHGKQLEKTVPVKVTRSSLDGYEVSSLGPVLIHASQFDLAAGVEALREIVGLQSIELMVPVTFDIHLTEI